MRGVNKDYSKLARTYRRRGWSVSYTKNSHLRWRGPQGQVVISASTPSDRRSRWHLVARLKRVSRMTSTNRGGQ